LLQYFTIVELALGRVATQDVEIGGVIIRAGEGVLGLANTANRDPEVFENADELDLERGARNHLAPRHRKVRGAWCEPAEVVRPAPTSSTWPSPRCTSSCIPGRTPCATNMGTRPGSNDDAALSSLAAAALVRSAGAPAAASGEQECRGDKRCPSKFIHEH
jgi:hypothetical protein